MAAIKTTNSDVNFAELLGLCGVTGLVSGTIAAPFNSYATDVSLFKDFWPNTVRFLPGITLSFALKETLKPILKFSQSDKKSNGVALAENFAAGGVAGILTHGLVYSVDNSYIRLKADCIHARMGEARRYNNLADAWKKTMASEGVGGLYKGFLSSCLGIFVFRGCFFGFYDTMKPILFGSDDHMAANLGLAYMTCIAADVIARPFYEISSEPILSLRSEVPYKGAMDYFTQVTRQGGYQSLFKGASGSVVRGVSGALVLAGFDYLKKEYLVWRDENQ